MADRSANLPKIEVTPAMIEAGLTHLYRYHPDRGVGAEETVARILQDTLKVGRDTSDRSVCSSLGPE